MSSTRIFFLASLIAVAIIGNGHEGARTVQAAPAPRALHWTTCVLHFGPAGGFQSKDCRHYLMPHQRQTPTGHTWREVLRTRTQSVRVTFPTFAPPAPTPQPAPTGHALYFWVTGYSWGCGTPNGITASGTIPHVGTIASNTLPFGAHVWIPSLGYSGVVEDRGAPLDLFGASCGATFAYTGYRLVYVS